MAFGANEAASRCAMSIFPEFLEDRRKEIGSKMKSAFCEAIQGAFISVSVILGIPVLRSRDAEESARLMLYASRGA